MSFRKAKTTSAAGLSTDPETIRKAYEAFSDLVRRLPAAALRDIDAVLKDWPIDPRTADVDAAWKAIWPKPLYAYARVPAADGWISELNPFMAGAWRTWGTNPASVIINKSETGRAADDFTLTGDRVPELRKASQVSSARLLAIQNAGLALRARSLRSETPVKDFWTRPLEELVPALKAELGWGWGGTTIIHMLTDFGVAVKPDRHVMRSLRALGIWNSPADQVSLSQGIAVNRAIRLLALALGELTPKNLRRIDIHLMLLSKYGII